MFSVMHVLLLVIVFIISLCGYAHACMCVCGVEAKGQHADVPQSFFIIFWDKRSELEAPSLL